MALISVEEIEKASMLNMEKKAKETAEIMETLSKMCLEDLGDKIQRVKVETLVTVHVHQRDLTTEIKTDVHQTQTKDPANDFEWTKNTRIYWNTANKGQVQICITDVTFTYSYEFLGSKERLCITPLTDRCYITLS